MREEHCPRCGFPRDSRTINEYGICSECLDEIVNETGNIERLKKEGRSDHCAKRPIWGDGECECSGLIHKTLCANDKPSKPYKSKWL